MNLRLIIYWLLSILTLLLCLSYAKPFNDDITAKPITLTSYFKVDPHFFYHNKNRFYLTVVGQLRLDIKTERIPADIINYNALVIEGYQFGHETELSLNWQVNEQIFQLVMNQSNRSINSIDFHTEDFSQVSDLHILITTTNELGVKNNFKDEVSFQSMYLDQLNNQSQLAINLSDWYDFTPISFSSINGYTNNADLHMKSLIFRLGSWLIVTILMYFLLRVNGSHLIVTFFLAWIISSYFFVTNHIKQHSQISQAFTVGQNTLNHTDREVNDLAEMIAKTITSTSTLLPSSGKFVLIGANSFDKLRLKNQLNQFNLAIRSNLKRLLDESADSKLNFILIGKQLKYCKKLSKYFWLNNQTELIHLDDNYCLLRKK